MKNLKLSKKEIDKLLELTRIEIEIINDELVGQDSKTIKMLNKELLLTTKLCNKLTKLK